MKHRYFSSPSEVGSKAQNVRVNGSIGVTVAHDKEAMSRHHNNGGPEVRFGVFRGYGIVEERIESEIGKEALDLCPGFERNCAPVRSSTFSRIHGTMGETLFYLREKMVRARPKNREEGDNTMLGSKEG